MFFDDHSFPHFHARDAEGAAKVRIDNLEVLAGSLGVVNFDWCSPGPRFTRTSWQITGDELGHMKH